MEDINIINSIHAKKQLGFQLSTKISENVTAGIIDGSQVIGYVLKGGADKLEQINPSSKKTFCPHINLQAWRNAVVITGDSDTGKTLIASIFIRQYKRHFPQDAIYFISTNDINDDENLNKLTYIQQLDTEELPEFKAENFQNSLILIDDCDYSKNKKLILNLMNDLVERGRKFNVSVIFISHLNSRLDQTIIYRDFDMYVTFRDNLLNNRLLENTLKVKPSLLKALEESAPSFVCFNKKYRCVITNKTIINF